MGKRLSLRSSSYLLESRGEEFYGSYKKVREDEHFTPHFENVSLQWIVVYSN